MQPQNYSQHPAITSKIHIYLLWVFLCLIASNQVFAEESESCLKWPKWFKPICTTLHDTWTKGSPDLYLTGYAWHNRYTYTKNKLNSYNEGAYGGGLGKGYEDSDKDWNALYMIAFLDSHKNVEPLGGYAFIKTAHFSKDVNAGIGYTVFITARPDIYKGRPFPGALPLVSLSILRLSIFATYIPGAAGAGNVLFCFAKLKL